MSIIKSNMTAPPPSGGSLSRIGEMNSLRFDGSSYLEKTDFANGSDTYTFSGWVKISEVGFMHVIFGACQTGNPYKQDITTIISNGYLQHYQFSNANIRYVDAESKPAVYRDPNAWYHVVTSYDATAGVVTLYVNGEAVGSDGTSSTYRMINKSGQQHLIGNYAYQSSAASHGGQFKGYMADLHFIDGIALPPTAFGEEISDVWVPKAYSGAYGSNGFHLDFHPDNRVYGGDGKLTKVLDTSGENNNDWDAAQ